MLVVMTSRISAREPETAAARRKDVSMRSRRPQLQIVLTVALAGAALTSCSSSAGAGAGSGACPATVVYQGQTYLGTGELRRDPATTGRRVDGVLPACDDSGGQRPVDHDQPVRVAELADVPLGTAFLWSGGVYLREGQQLPAAAQLWFRPRRCTTPGEFELTGDWLGVTGPEQPGSDGELRPPYRLEVHVTAGRHEYVGTTIAVHADAGTSPGLEPRDVKSSLWNGGQVVARVSCVDGRFRASSLRTRAAP
jgi:hypothetical protein